MRLGFPLLHPLIDMVHECAQGLPIVSGHVVQTGNRTFRVYWVSGSSLVIFDSSDTEQTPFGFVTRAAVTVHSLASADLDVDVVALDPSTMDPRSVTITVQARFDGEPEAVTLPDPAYALDNQANRNQASAFISAVLRAATQS